MTPPAFAGMTRGLAGNKTYDVLIIGGGITGCAMAYEAAAQGLSVALIEKGDLGAATSAATGKLIHGGLRYLKNLELGLVRESLAERRILSNIAPGLVEPFPMVLPDPGLVAHLGLWTYDLLSFDRNRVNDPAHRIPAHRTMKAGELAAHGLSHIDDAVLYYDCIMPYPERLTLAFARSAQAFGADLLTHARATKLLTDGKKAIGIEYQDRFSGETTSVHARLVVNATGPWAHDMLATNEETKDLAGPKPKSRSEGIYLVTRQLSDIMVLYVSERGHFSFAPWRGHSLIGPTETPYTGAVDDWRVTREAVETFLTHINETSRLPEPLTIDDVKAVYGGLRPLVESEGDDSYDASRASELMDHGEQGIEGLVTATGGKYTTSRAFAEKAVDKVLKKLGRKGSGFESDRTPLHGCDIGIRDRFIAGLKTRWPEFSEATLTHLARCYGTQADDVLALTRENPGWAQPLDEDGELLAQAVYAVRFEAAMTLEDVVMRRMGLGTLGDPGEATLNKIAETTATEAGWSHARLTDEMANLQNAIRLPEPVPGFAR